MSNEYLNSTIKTEVEDIDYSVNNEFIQMDFNVDDPPEITDQPIVDTLPQVGNFKCIQCGLMLPSKTEYDLHQQSNHQLSLGRRPRTSALNLAESYDPESEDVDDPNYVPHGNGRSLRPILPKPRTLQEIIPIPTPIVHSPGPSSIIVGEKNYKCSQCFFSTENESLIREHMAKNKHSFKYQCNYCTKSFQFVYMLNNHHRSCHKDDEPCFDEFVLHELKESDNLVCSLCCHTEKHPKSIEEHFHRQHSQSSRTFSYYIESYATKAPKPSLMGNNLLSQNKDGESNGPRVVKTTGLYTYSGTRGGRRSKYALQSDSMATKSDVSELFYKCIDCHKWFNTHRDCKGHQIQYHSDQNLPLYISYSNGGNKVPDDNLTKYYCIRCTEECYSTSEMKTHCKIHKIASQPLQYVRLLPNGEHKLVEEATYKCSQCEVMPDTLMFMQKHWTESHPNKVFKVMKLYADTADKNYICKVCSKIFKHAVMLTLHEKTKHQSESGTVRSISPQQPMIISPQPSLPAPMLVVPTPSKEQLPPKSLKTILAHTYVPPTHTAAPTQAPIEVAKPVYSKTTVPSESPGKIVVEKYQCLYCSQSYTLFEKLKEHHKEEHSDFTWLYLYVRHMDNGSIDVISSGDKLYRCFYCQEDFGKNFSLLSVHYKDHHAPLNFKYHICDGKDGFAKWYLKEHILKLVPEQIQPPYNNNNNNNTTSNNDSNDNNNVDNDSILPDIKPDIRELDALIAAKRQQEEENQEESSTIQTPPPCKKIKLEQDSQLYGYSWYRKEPSQIDLDKVVIRRTFNNSSFKIAVSNIISVMNLNPKVKVDDYRLFNAQN